jgi:hypothetical protein
MFICNASHNHHSTTFTQITNLLSTANVFRPRTALFWDITQRRVVIAYRSFVATYRSLDPWRWDRYVVPKHRYGIVTLRCVISQKNADIIWIAADVWNHPSFDRIWSSASRSYSSVTYVWRNNDDSFGMRARADVYVSYLKLFMEIYYSNTISAGLSGRAV